MNFKVDEHKLHIIHQRNFYLMILLWLSLVPAIGNQLKFHLPFMQMFWMDIFIIVPAIIVTFSVIKKKIPILSMYVVGIGVGIGFSNSLIDTHLYAGLFIAMMIIALYQEWKVTVLNGLVVLVGFNIFYNQYISFETSNGLIILNIMLVLQLIILIFYTIGNDKVRRKMVAEQNEVHHSKKEVDHLLVQSKDSEEKLHHFNLELNQNLTHTKKISNELANSFKDITLGVEGQANSINDINLSLHEVEKLIEMVSAKSKEVFDSSNETEKIASEYSDEIRKTAQKMEIARHSVDQTFALINELNEKNKTINNVLHTLNEITNQTNLLALNASIEAARAGEAGKGFVVVAGEVKKLAEYSRVSAEEIRSILGEIQLKTTEVTSQINDGIIVIEESKDTLIRSEETFHLVTEKAKKAKISSDENDKVMTELKHTSLNIIKEMNVIASVSEEITSSIEEVLSSIETQNENLDNIVLSFNKLK